MEKHRPRRVQEAIASGDQNKIRTSARAGGKATAEKADRRADERETLAALEAEMHADSMRDAANARRDHVLPADD